MFEKVVIAVLFVLTIGIIFGLISTFFSSITGSLFHAICNFFKRGR